jgi:hypothetical protein
MISIVTKFKKYVIKKIRQHPDGLMPDGGMSGYG